MMIKGNLPGQHVIERMSGNFWEASGPPLSFSRKVTKGLTTVAPADLSSNAVFFQASVRLELVDDMIVRHHLSTGNSSKCRREARIPTRG